LLPDSPFALKSTLTPRWSFSARHWRTDRHFVAARQRIQTQGGGVGNVRSGSASIRAANSDLS
jgi:hypothetical protein